MSASLALRGLQGVIAPRQVGRGDAAAEVQGESELSTGAGINVHLRQGGMGLADRPVAIEHLLPVPWYVPGATEHDFQEQQTVREDLPKITSSVPGSFMEQLTGAVRAQFVEGIDPTEERYDAKVAQAEQVISDMTQVWLRWQPETSALKNSVQQSGFLLFLQLNAVLGLPASWPALLRSPASGPLLRNHAEGLHPFP